MKWQLRKSQKKYEVPEFPDTREPRKSILRGKDSTREDYPGGTASFADIRSATSVKESNVLTQKLSSSRESSMRLRSVDNRRRNVLFLDQVERGRKPSMAELPASRSQTSSPGSSSNTYASYPTSYQPSPLFQKRDLNGCDIELVSRAPLSPSESENATDSYISPRLKRWLRMSSLNQRWKQKHLDSHRADDDSAEEEENEVPMAEALRRYPSRADRLPPNRDSDSRSGSEINSLSIERDRNRNFNVSNSYRIDTESPVVRRPARPNLVETQTPILVYDGLKITNACVDNSRRPKGFQHITANPSDSTETLRPQARKTLIHDAQSPTSKVRSICNIQITPKVPEQNLSRNDLSPPVTTFISGSRQLNAPSRADQYNIRPTRSVTRIVYASEAVRKGSQTGSEPLNIPIGNNDERSSPWNYQPVNKNSVLGRSVSVVRPSQGFRW